MGEVTPNHLEWKQGAHNWKKLILNVEMKRKKSNVNQHAINFKHNPIVFNAILQNLTWGYESSENMWKTFQKYALKPSIERIINYIYLSL